MVKLWVDDIRQAPSDSWTVARTINEAIRAINMFDFDEISLDHDISHQVAVGELSRPYPCNECFCAVAHYIANLNNDKVKVTIHTSSPVGGKEMYEILKGKVKEVEIKMMGLSNRLEMEV